MKKIILWLLLFILAGALLRAYRNAQHEIVRLEENQQAMSEKLLHYETRLGDSVASCRVLRLRCREFEELREQDAAEIRALGIRLKRAEAMAHTQLASAVEITTPLRDTLCRQDTVRNFCWRDPWVELRGEISNDTLHCHVQSVDTLIQVIHRVPRRFWFIRWGTKAIRQEILCKNPHTRVVYAEYISLEKQNK